MRTHTGERPYLCDFAHCNFAAFTSGSLDVHKRTHSGDRPYKCDFEGCDFAASQGGTLIAHKRIHTGAKPFKCDFAGCVYVANQSSALQVHRRTHTGVKPYQCEVDGCDYVATVSNHLTAHSRTHTGERPYKCKFDGCTYAAAASGPLVEHERIHTGERPFKCDFHGCSYASARWMTLVLHKRTHTGEKPYTCDFEGCDYTCARSDHLTGHHFYHHTREGNVRMKQEEARILRVLQEAAMDFTEQHMIDFRCVGKDRDGDRAWIDFLVQVKDTSGHVKGIVLLEVDEEQHRAYSVTCEVRRMSDVHRSLMLAGNTFPVAFCRYNPNAFSINGKTCKVTKKEREAGLIGLLQNWEFSREFEVVYLHHDTTDGVCDLLCDPEYDESFRQCVRT